MVKQSNNKIKVHITDDNPSVVIDKNRPRTEEREKIRDINNSLSEIYQDESGEKINVDKFNIKKKRGLVFWFINSVLIGLVLVVLSLGFFYYIYNGGADSTAVNFKIDGPDSINANEEFIYKVKYKNVSGVPLSNVEIKMNYPDNFIFLDSEPKPSDQNFIWKIERVGSRSSGEIAVKGKIIGKSQSSSILLAEMRYMPDNFSSEFKKEASFNTILKDVGFTADINYPGTSLVDEDNEISIDLKAVNDNYLRSFEIGINKSDNIKILSLKTNDDSGITLEKAEGENWLISNLGEQDEEIILSYRVIEKVEDIENMVFTFSQFDNSNNKVVFLEKNIEMEIMKSDLNLTLIVNGNQSNQPVDFEETLNYSIVYANKGEATMKDVVIMAVLESDFLNWTTLNDQNYGRERGNTITWTKEEIDDLETIGVDEEGIIDFSIDIASFREGDLGGKFSVVSFAQYDIGQLDKIGDIATSTTGNDDLESKQINADNKSNTIVNEINSDLELKEELRYFNEDNIPVGDGPIPPKVGENTIYKVYWTLNNNLHELNELKVETVLPEYIDWAEKNRTSVGSISYDEQTRKVTWYIGRLPITVYRSDAEFSIKFLPKESDRNKVVVLTTGSTITAKDVDTGDMIEKSTGPRTSKLEDDDIAAMSSDGRVQ